MDAREFVDELYKVWAQTSEAEAGLWAYEPNNEIGGWEVRCVPAEGSARKTAPDGKIPIADFVTEADARFIASIHAAIPDLVREIHETLDENERLDQERDQIASELFEAGLEIQRLRRDLEVLRG
ncbi:hypothetical protein [Nocardia sp. IFM 10818]